MATAFGNKDSGFYPLGLITVATSGTPVALSKNVSISTVWGTASGGVPPYNTAGQQSTINCNAIIISAPSTNTGDVFLVFKGQAYNGTGGTSVIVVVAKGTSHILQSPNLNRPFQIDQLGLDAATNGDGAYITVVNP